VIDFSLVLLDSAGGVFFASAEREALRGMGRLADVIYVRRAVAGHEDSYDAGEIVMGTQSTLLEMIRAGAERAICEQLVVLDVGALTSFAGAAALALELTRTDKRSRADQRDDDDTPTVDFVAGRVVDGGGNVLFRAGALALDGSLRLRAGLELGSELRPGEPTLVCDPRAFAARRDLLLRSWRGGAMPVDETGASELAWRTWLLGGRAVSSASVSVVAADALLPASARPWKATLARLLDEGSLAHTPEAHANAASGADQVLTRLVRASGAGLAAVESSRNAIQAVRKRPDADLFSENVLAVSWDVAGTSESRRRRIAVLCSDSIGSSMAGPAIRSIELARVLGEQADVRIAARLEGEMPTGLPCPVHTLADVSIDELLRWADAIVLQGPLTHWHPEILRSELPIAIDLYDPLNLEALESVDPDSLVPYTTNLLRDQLWRGDFFFCASERQRDFWLGMLAACGRITPASYAEDPDLDSLIGVVPYGIADEEPTRRGPGIREELGIAPADPLFVWNGGIWQWFDPDLLVLAIDRLREEIPNVRALFMGVRRPGTELTFEAIRLEQLIIERGLGDGHVFVRDWTPYAERADTYLDATAIVSLHHAHIETRFSFRTRLLDCIWSATPIVCTMGDVLAPMVRDEDLGITVPAGDLDAIVDALRLLATDRERVAGMRSRLRALAPGYHWGVAAAPLVAWSSRPIDHRSDRFPVTGLDPALAQVPQIAAPSLGLKRIVPRPVRQYVLGPLKRRLKEST
jgi:glycosyltransferase involved in cell wall biosynthesis